MYLHLCIFLILIFEFLVGALEFRMEFRGLYPVNYLNLSPSPSAGNMTSSPREFLNRIQMRTELVLDTLVIRGDGVEGSEFL